MPPLPPYISMPGEPFELGSLTDLASLVLGLVVLFVTGLVALRQFRLMKEQDAIINRQVTLLEETRDINGRIEQLSKEQKEFLIAQHKLINNQLQIVVEQRDIARRMEDVEKEQKGLLERQGGMIERQGEIAEAQQKLVKEQLARRAVLALEVAHKTPKPATSPGHTAYNLNIHNSGDKTCKELYLTLLVPRDRVGHFGIDPLCQIDEWAIVNGQYYHHFSIHLEKAIFPGRRFEVGKVTISKVEYLNVKHLNLLWAIVSEDGREPKETTRFHETLLQQEPWQPGERPGSPV